MAGATREDREDAQRNFRDPPEQDQRLYPSVTLRQISIAFASIADGDILPGELVFNIADQALVFRADDTNIYAWTKDASRTI